MRLDFEIVGSKGALGFTQERFNELQLYRMDDPRDRRGFRTIFAGPEHPPYGDFCVAGGHQLGFNDLKTIEVRDFLLALAGEKTGHADFREGAGGDGNGGGDLHVVARAALGESGRMSIGIGIIGAGVMGADHARSVATAVGGAHLAALSDADADRAARVAAETGAARRHADAIALIADPAVDAVLIASPDATHAQFVLACLKAGKPVLCEKPLAATLAEAEAIIAAETALGRRLVQVGFMRRFDPGYADMKARLDAGEIGAAVMLHAVHRNAAVPAWFESEMVITNSAVHDIDVARFLLGEEIVAATVFAPPAPARVGGRSTGSSWCWRPRAACWRRSSCSSMPPTATTCAPNWWASAAR